MKRRMEADGKHECYAKAVENVRARVFTRVAVSRLKLARSFLPLAADDSFGGINQA